MSKIFSFLVFIFLSVCFFGCTKKFNIDLGANSKVLVVEGNIFNVPGPYYVRLTWSRAALSSLSSRVQYDNAEPVKNATVIISDNVGNIDTLRPAPDSLKQYYKFYLKRDQVDSLYREDELTQGYKRGFYTTTSLRGAVGRTYRLRIQVENKTYTADAYMPQVTHLDSIQVRFKNGIKDNIKYKVPALYFSEPTDQQNYYWYFGGAASGILDTTKGVGYFYSTNGFIPFSIFDDRFLKPYVEGLIVQPTYTKEQNETDLVGNYGWYNIASLTPEHFQYLKTLIDQLNADGGTYKPAPANPRTNLTNGALGYFGASAVSRYFYIDPSFK
jgi:hypothetical protein